MQAATQAVIEPKEPKEPKAKKARKEKKEKKEKKERKTRASPAALAHHPSHHHSPAIKPPAGERCCQVSQLNIGDKVSRVSYATVVGKHAGGIRLQNESGFEWDIGQEIVEHEIYSATQFLRTQVVTQTELAHLLTNDVADSCFAITFEKKLKADEVNAALQEADYVNLTTETKKRKAVSQAIHGHSRRLIGYRLHSEPLMGRSMVVDLEVPTTQHRTRLIDHRTISELIFKNTRYKLK